MRWQAKAFLSTVPVALLAGGLGWHWWSEELLEQQRAEEDSSEIIIGAPAGAQCRLYASGRTVDSAQLLREEPCRAAWLPKGTYFMSVSVQGSDFHYPVPVLGYRFGPDRDGSFVITVRPPLQGSPPGPRTHSGPWQFIPSGHFLIGDRQTPREPHYVWLPSFFIRSFEVTNAEFRDFLRDGGGYTADEWWTDAGREWKRRERSTASAMLTRADANYVRFGQDDQPVTLVTWFEAMAYAAWLNARDGAGQWMFSLPTDAEWEKAARGPDGFDYGLSAGISDAESKLYNWRKNPDVPVTVVGLAETTRTYPKNRYGIYHTSGNVAEWTRSAFWPYNREQPYQDDRRNLAETPGSRTARGGSWYSATSATLYNAYRDAFEPNHRSNDVGFRIIARPRP
jgi:formylglycine-generating enzyme required for sulfatase activity